MQYFTTVTQKGQITLPKTLRDLLNLDKYDSVELTVNDNSKQINIKKALDIVDMAGTLRVDKKLLKKYPVEKTREIMEQSYGKFEKNSGRF